MVNLIKIFLISIFITSIINIYPNDNSTDSEEIALFPISNNSMDTTTDKKRILHSLSFGFRQKIDSYFDSYANKDASFFNEFFFDISTSYKIWSFKGKLENIFITNFRPLIYRSDSTTGLDIFFNSLSFGIENKLHFKNIIKINFNFSFYLNTPFYDYPIFCFYPEIMFEGNYYTGLFWTIQETVVINLYSINNSLALNSETNLKLGYEFFRFYGPKYFKFSIVTEDFLNTTIIGDYRYILNILKGGVAINLYNFLLYIYFTNEIKYYFGSTDFVYTYIGLNSIIDYSFKFFSVNFEHKFLYDTTSSNTWLNSFSFYVKFQFFLH